MLNVLAEDCSVRCHARNYRRRGMPLWILLSSQYNDDVSLPCFVLLSERKHQYCDNGAKTLQCRETLQHNGAVLCLQLPMRILLPHGILASHSLSKGKLLPTQLGLGKELLRGRVPGRHDVRSTDQDPAAHHHHSTTTSQHLRLLLSTGISDRGALHGWLLLSVRA